MKFSQIKGIINVCNTQFSKPEYREVVENLIDSNEDFTIDNVRFIKSSEIDRILGEELSSDKYVLGCFSTDFICENTKLNYEMVKACKELEAFEAIGKGILSDCGDDLAEFAEAYASADGYGHHFNHYDGSEQWEVLLGNLYYIFDNR